MAPHQPKPPQLQCRAAATARAPWAAKVTTNDRPAWAQSCNPHRPPQELHCTLLPGLVAGQATNRTPSWRNTACASGGTRQTAGGPCRCRPAAMERDSVEAGAEAGLGGATLLAGKGAGRRAGEAAGAGDRNRPGFGIAAGEAEGSAMGLGWGHG